MDWLSAGTTPSSQPSPARGEATVLRIKVYRTISGAQCRPSFIMALSVVRSLRMHATSANFLGLPASTRRR